MTYFPDELLPQTPEHSLIKSIENHECKITFVGEPGGQSKTRTISGDAHSGLEFVYEIKVRQPDRDWVTELRVWIPHSIVEKHMKQRPKTNIFIQAGMKEIVLTDDPDHKKIVLNEICRQLEESREKELEKT